MIKVKLSMSEQSPTKAGYYWAVKKGENIPKIVSVVRNSDKAWVNAFEWIEDETKRQVNNNIQGYVPKFVAEPLGIYQLWSEDSIPNPEGYEGLFLNDNG